MDTQQQLRRQPTVSTWTATMTSKLCLIYRVEEGILDGTEIKPVQGLIAVHYPHRKPDDLYIPPMQGSTKWHCCQDKCLAPDFDGGIDALLEHLMLHKGRLLRPWNRKAQLQAPIPAIKLPVNSWLTTPKNERNNDRRFCVELYIECVKDALRGQGLEILEVEP